jgi:hypothetical protein
MPRCASWAVATPCGNAVQTLAALTRADALPGRLPGELLPTLVALGHQALAGASCDLVVLATAKGDLPRWCESLLAGHPAADDGGPAALARALGTAFACPAYAVMAACASGPAALAEASRIIAAGDARRVLVLGGDRLAPFVNEGFAALQAVDPSGCCKPFDADRAGIILGETAAALVLDDQPGGVQISGWGQSLDAHHLTHPCRDGAGLARACRAALAKAGAQRPGGIIAHGTGTRSNDEAEAAAYAQIAADVPVIAWKGGLGHSLGPCGLTEVALAAEAWVQDLPLPGTIGWTRPGTAVPVSIRPAGAHRLPLPWLSPNAGFGGMNGAVVLDTVAAPPLSSLMGHVACRIDVMPDAQWRTSDGRQGVWDVANDGGLPRPTARQILGHIDPNWGRMDTPSRLLVAMGHLLGPWPDGTGVVLLSDSGSADSDLRFERSRLTGAIEHQTFAYTLASAPVGEAGIRLRLTGPGQVLAGAHDDQGRASARRLLADGAPAVLVARIETHGNVAWAERWIA